MMSSPRNVLVSGDVELDLDGYVAWVRGRRQPLTLSQFRLLRTLMLHDGEALARRHLRGPAMKPRSVSAAVSRLRALLSESQTVEIQAVPRRGYRLLRRVRDASYVLLFALYYAVAGLADEPIVNLI